MGNQQGGPGGKKDEKEKEKKKYEAPIPTRVGKKKRNKVINKSISNKIVTDIFFVRYAEVYQE